MADSKIARAEHCAYCFDMLLEELTNVASEYDWTSLPLGHAKMPVFVTWYKRSIKKKYDELRGCLGTFSQELPIGIGLKKYCIMSALNDKRFDPISVSEISYLKCSISLLHSFTRAKSWDDWELGTHGITIQFTDHSNLHSASTKSYNATYLPEVPGQQKWNKLITIENLVSKAGFNGNASMVKNLTVTKYQSCKAIMTWHQFLNYIKTHHHHRTFIKRVQSLQACTTPQLYNIIVNNDPVFYAQSPHPGINPLDLTASQKQKASAKQKGKLMPKQMQSNQSKKIIKQSLASHHNKTKIKTTSKFGKTKIKSATKKLLRYGSNKLKLSASPPPFHSNYKANKQNMGSKSNPILSTHRQREHDDDDKEEEEEEEDEDDAEEEEEELNTQKAQFYVNHRDYKPQPQPPPHHQYRVQYRADTSPSPSTASSASNLLTKKLNDASLNSPKTRSPSPLCNSHGYTLQRKTHKNYITYNPYDSFPVSAYDQYSITDTNHIPNLRHHHDHRHHHKANRGVEHREEEEEEDEDDHGHIAHEEDIDDETEIEEDDDLDEEDKSVSTTTSNQRPSPSPMQFLLAANAANPSSNGNCSSDEIQSTLHISRHHQQGAQNNANSIYHTHSNKKSNHQNDSSSHNMNKYSSSSSSLLSAHSNQSLSANTSTDDMKTNDNMKPKKLKQSKTKKIRKYRTEEISIPLSPDEDDLFADMQNEEAIQPKTTYIDSDPPPPEKRTKKKKHANSQAVDVQMSSESEVRDHPLNLNRKSKDANREQTPSISSQSDTESQPVSDGETNASTANQQQYKYDNMEAYNNHSNMHRSSDEEVDEDDDTDKYKLNAIPRHMQMSFDNDDEEEEEEEDEDEDVVDDDGEEEDEDECDEFLLYSNSNHTHTHNNIPFYSQIQPQ
eukprot:CAMPEP_0197079464 /NCGR_PEP_ID=MMETSP1384-20130603/213639_1 /TAXON_ID=29189 /ORGANISM="Ammonia sp." /LENGTH=895 /DNA_ID=CAMNT_0042518341 /DNA_START=123 /DNA_END=2810 /DNA_ORIENTATION=+